MICSPASPTQVEVVQFGLIVDVIVSLPIMQMHQFDDEKFESRIQKLKDSLFVHDPQLAQLVKLDSTDTTDVQQDTERQLMYVIY